MPELTDVTPTGRARADELLAAEASRRVVTEEDIPQAVTAAFELWDESERRFAAEEVE